MQLTVYVQEWDDFGLEPTSLVVDATNITINGTSNVGAADSLSVAVTDNSTASITISQTGYLPYSVEIDNVYDEDRDLYILLSRDITDTNDPEYLLPHPYFFSFTSPCSFQSTAYVASSYVGETKWYLNDICIGENLSKIDGTFSGAGNFQLKLGSKTEYTRQLDPCTWVTETAWLRQWANGDSYTGQVEVRETGNTVFAQDVLDSDLVTYLALDTKTNIVQEEYRPSFFLTASAPYTNYENLECYTAGETVTITADITLTRPNSLLNEYALQWKVWEPDGALIIDTAQSLVTTPYEISFTFADLGKYTIEATVIDNYCCDAEYKQELVLETCDFFYVESTGECGEFNLVNVSSSKEVNYRVEFITGTPIEAEGTLSPTGELGNVDTIQLTELGIHAVHINYDDSGETINKSYIINNFCGLWDCLAGYINDLICNSRDLCDPCPEATLLNEMVLLNYAYSMMLNKEYSFNNFYSTLDESKLAEYQDINNLATKVKELCNRISCGGICTTITNPVNQFSFGLSKANNKTNGCGCGGKCGGSTKSSGGGCGCK